MFRLTLFMLVLAAPTLAFAAETECPQEDPEHPGHRLVGGWPRFQNCDCGEDAEEIQRGDSWQRTIWLEKWQEYHGELICMYRAQDGGGRNLELKVPGLMIRYDSIGLRVPKPKPVAPGTGGPYEIIVQRVWCTSKP
jgi:hypothetical protein